VAVPKAEDHAPPAPKRERPISSNLAATLAAGMPKYNPPPKPKPQDEAVDLREVDKPRNGIIRLPNYTVREKKPPVFRERDIYTSKGLGELARHRYLTPTYRLLNSVYVPFLTASPTQHAMAMYAEDERLNNMSELEDNARTVEKSDPEDGAYIRRASNETFMRSRDFGFDASTVNRNR
ncbi:MAG TPA: hypothetical protein VNR00_08945, partial [Opitutus sp.]|nr:hypothetical protein [Opitutus sp.]